MAEIGQAYGEWMSLSLFSTSKSQVRSLPQLFFVEFDSTLTT